jgi:hypothetical protein
MKCRLPTVKQEHKPNRRSPSENYLGRCETTFLHYARVSSSDGQQTYLELPRTSLVAVRPQSLIASTIPSSSDGQTGTRKAKSATKNPRFTCGSDHSGTSCSSHNLTERNSGIKSLPNSATGTHSTIGSGSLQHGAQRRPEGAAATAQPATWARPPAAWARILRQPQDVSTGQFKMTMKRSRSSWSLRVFLCHRSVVPASLAHWCPVDYRTCDGLCLG